MPRSSAAGARADQGNFVAPTLYLDARHEMKIAQEEIFGPVLTMIPFADEEEALAIANDVRYGLAAYRVDPRRRPRAPLRPRAGSRNDLGQFGERAAPADAVRRHEIVAASGATAATIPSTSTWRRRTSRSRSTITRFRRSDLS